MPEIANLAVVLSVTGANSVVNALTQVTQNIRVVNQAAKETSSSGGLGSLENSFLSTFYSAQALVAGFEQIVAVAGQVTGVSIAAEYSQIQKQLEATTGSASKAAEALQAFSDIGGKTKFDTADVAGFGNKLLTQIGDVGEVKRDISAILDVSAAGGVSRAAGNRFMENIVQIRGQERPNLIDIRQMLRAGPGIGRILGIATGQGPLNENQVADMAKKMGGREFFDTLVKAAQLPGVKGAAENVGPIDAFGNLMESLNKIMLPTGAILLPVLAGVGKLVQGLSDLLGSLNRLTGGTAGLYAIGMVLVRGWGVIIGVMRLAMNEVMRLTDSIAALAVSSRVASAATAGSAAGGAAAAAGGAAGAAAGTARAAATVAGEAAEVGAAAGGMASALGTVGRVAGFALRFVEIVKGFIPFVAGWGLGVLGEKAGGGATRLGSILQNAGVGVGWGSIAGTIIGGIIGIVGGPAGIAAGAGLGNLIGGAIGAVGGGLYGGFKGLDKKDDSTQQQIAANTAKAAEALDKMRWNITGGGGRTKNTTSQLEIEMALYRAVYDVAG